MGDTSGRVTIDPTTRELGKLPLCMYVYSLYSRSRCHLWDDQCSWREAQSLGHNPANNLDVCVSLLLSWEAMNNW